MTPAERALLLFLAMDTLGELDDWNTPARAERRQKLRELLEDLRDEFTAPSPSVSPEEPTK